MHYKKYFRHQLTFTAYFNELCYQVISTFDHTTLMESHFLSVFTYPTLIVISCTTFPFASKARSFTCHATPTNCPFLAGVTDVLSVSQTRRSGILWQIICVIRSLNSTVLGVSWRNSCLHTVMYNV